MIEIWFIVLYLGIGAVTYFISTKVYPEETNKLKTHEKIFSLVATMFLWLPVTLFLLYIGKTVEQRMKLEKDHIKEVVHNEDKDKEE